MADFSNVAIPFNILSAIKGAYVEEQWYKVDGVEGFVKLTEILATISGSGSFPTYDAGNLVTVTGSKGITTTKSNGIITIVLPENGTLVHGFAQIRPGDSIYNNGTVSDAIKLVIDNSASGTGIHSISPQFMGQTSGSEISAGNPLIYNSAINNDCHIDEHENNKVGWVFQQIPGRASAGGFIYF
jgi:hypothetical protein